MTRALRNLYLLAVVAFLSAPLAVVVGVSLNAKKRLLFPPEGLSLRWYGELFADAGWLGAVVNSLMIALTSGIFALTVALPLAYFLWRYRLRYAKALFALGVAPFLLPPVITALGFLIFWATVGFYGQLGAVVISHGIFFVTLPLVTLSLGFESIDQEVIDAAETLGADGRRVFLTVILPLLLPYLVSGYAFVFVLSLNEYIVAFMVAGFTVETLPIKIFNSLRYGYTPVMAVVAVLFALLAAMVFGLVGRFGNLPRLLGALGPEER